MKLMIQISDKAYEQLISSGSRLQGTIGLVSPHEGNFNEHNRHGVMTGERDYRYIRLRHGRASVDGRQVRLSLRIDLDESDVVPSEAIERESREASDFVDDALEAIEPYP